MAFKEYFLLVNELTSKTCFLHTSNISRMFFFVFIFVQLRNYRVVTVTLIIMRHARYSVPVFVDVGHLTLQYNTFQLGVSLGSAGGQLGVSYCKESAR